MLSSAKPNKKRIFKIYIKQLLLFVFSFLLFNAGAYADSSVQTPQTYKITLPQKVAGVKKLEYVIDKKNMGSVSGQNDINAASNSVLNFLVQIESENYSKLRVKDVKIHSHTGQTLSLMKYMYDKDGNLTKVVLPENETIDTNQTYITSDYNVFYDDILSLNALNKDSFKAVVNMEPNDYQITEALDLSYTLDKEQEQKTPIHNSGNNSFEITDITINTPIKLKLTTKEDFSKSEIKAFIGEEQLTISPDGNINIPAIKSDINITVKDINKNKYSLSFENYEDLSFKYKNHSSEGDFIPVPANTLNVIAGESYDFIYTTSNNGILSNKEITANSVALKETSGIYSILNIKEDIKIDINSKEACYYKVNLPGAHSGIFITDENDAKINYAKSKFGENFKFKIKANEGYTRNITDALIYAVPTDKLENGDYDTEKNKEEAASYLLTPSYSDIYTISDVKEPVSIIVKNLERDSYKVTFPENLIGVSYKVTTSEDVKEISRNSFSVKHGTKMLVTLAAEEGKSVENASIGSTNSNVLITKNNNEYTIENITDDINLAVNNIEDKKCKITFENEGILCKDEQGYVFSQENIVADYKGSIKFSVDLKKGYKTNGGIELSIKSGNAKLNKLSDKNFYELSDIMENIIITAQGIEKEQVTVNLSSAGNSVVFKSTENNEPLPNINKVDYGSDISFTVSSNNDSNQQYTVTSSDENTSLETLDSSNNTFVVRNLSANTTLSASPVFASSYEATNSASDIISSIFTPDYTNLPIFTSADSNSDNGEYIAAYCNKDRIYNEDVSLTFTLEHDNYIYTASNTFNPATSSTDIGNYCGTVLPTNEIKVPFKINGKNLHSDFSINFTIQSRNCPDISIDPRAYINYIDKHFDTGDYGYSQCQTSNYHSPSGTSDPLPYVDPYAIMLGHNGVFTQYCTYKFTIGEVSITNCNNTSTLSIPVSYDIELTTHPTEYTGDFLPPIFQDIYILFDLNSKHSDSFITFNDSANDAYFINSHGENLTLERQNVNADKSFTFKLKCQPYKKFATTDETILLSALTIQNSRNFTGYFDATKSVYIIRPPNADITTHENTISYEIQVIPEESDDNCVTYKIYNISASYDILDNPIELFISVNTNLITEKYFQCDFTGSNVQYFNMDETEHFTSKPLRINDEFAFKPLPSISAAREIEAIYIVVNNVNYAYTFPKEEGNQTGKINFANNNLQIASKVESGKLIIELSNIKSDFKFITKYKRKELDATFTSDGLFKYHILSPNAQLDTILPSNGNASDSIKINYGKTLSFVIEANDGVDISNIVVTSNGAYINMVNGKYTIKSISDTQDIRAIGASKLKYDITFTQYDDIFFKDTNSRIYSEQTPVEHGTNIDFKVTTSDAYSKHLKDITVHAECASGNTLTIENMNQSNGNPETNNGNDENSPGSTDDNEITLSYNTETNTYRLSNVNQPVRIYVDDIEPNDYDVTLQIVDGIKYYNQYGTEEISPPVDSNDKTKVTVKVCHGENFSFKVVAMEGFDISNLKIYDKEGINGVPTQLLSAREIYTINNITDDHMVTAQNISSTKCKLEFRVSPGAHCIDSSGSNIEGHVEVNYGLDYKFKLSLDSAYNKSNPTVTIKGSSSPLPPDANGIYTIPNVQEDKIVEILNVTKNSYTATFKDTEGVIYKTAKNKPFTGTQPVEYEGTLYFKISLMDAYDKSTPLVMMDDKKTLGENSGIYSISNIQNDVTITVKNVVKNPEEVSISDIANISTAVSSESDVDAVVHATQTYMNLSDEDKEQVTNIDDLKKAQTNAGNINHSSNGVEVSGIDWNIKIIVTPLSDNEEQMTNFAKKVDRRSLFSLYEIHLVDVMTGLGYEVPFGQKVSVILPAPNLKGCTNAVVAHEKDEGNMEYLDLNIVDNRAQFETSSFSMFGIAAKRIQNYVDNPSDMKISVASLVDNEDELKSLLGEGLVSQLGSLINNENKTEEQKYNNYTDDSTSSELSSKDAASGIKKLFNKANLENTYNWILDNELLSVIIILLIGALLIWLLLFIAHHKDRKKQTK